VIDNGNIDTTWILTFEFYTIKCIGRPINVIDNRNIDTT